MAEGVRLTITGGPEVMERLALRQAAVAKAQTRAMGQALNVVYRRVQDNLMGRVLKVDTGRLRQSIQTEVQADGSRGIIGTNVEYGAIHEYGGVTKPHTITAKGKALRFVSPRFTGPVQRTAKGKISKKARSGVIFAKSVNHPGSVVPARPWLRPALRESMPEINELFRKGLAAALGKAS